MTKVLVTGAAGFIGSHTVDQLLKSGHRVLGVDNFRTGRVANLAGISHPEFELERCDVLSAKFDRLVRGFRPDAIIHCAALVSVAESISQPEINFRLNVEGTHRVAEMARQHLVPRLVFASSAAVYGDSRFRPITEKAPLSPISPYGAAKLASEHLLLAYAASYGLTIRIQRYFNVYGLRQDPSSPYSGVISIFLDRWQRRLPITIYGDGKQTRDFVHVADVARANLLAATKQGVHSGVANICTGQPTTLLRLVGELNRLRPFGSPPTHAPARHGDIRHSLGSPVAARRAIGFVANRSITRGLAELVAAQAS